MSEPGVPTNQATKLPLQALPWLPRPSGKMRERLASLPAEPLQALQFLQSLAQAAWGDADLRVLGRKITGILKSAPASLTAEARKHGLVPVRILILSASTASHISDALIGTAIRFKFLLDVTIAEYEEPEPWLERNSGELRENPPDFVLVASDHRMLKLASPLGDEAAAAQIVEAALARIGRIAEVAEAATARPVILQTLAGDPDAIQFNMDLGLPGSPRYLAERIQPAPGAQGAAGFPAGARRQCAGRPGRTVRLVRRTLLVCREVSVRDRHDPALRRQRHANPGRADGTIAPRAGSRSRQHDVGRHRRRRRDRRVSHSATAARWAKPIRRCSGWRYP